MNSCEKKSFATKEEALQRLAEIIETSDKTIVPRRYYKCQNCGMYHLTSITRRTQKMIINRPKVNMEKRIQREAEYYIKKNNWD